MKQMFAFVILASALVACSGKQSSTTPAPVSPENSSGAYGGAAYAGHKPGAPAPGVTTKGAPPTATTPANPCAAK